MGSELENRMIDEYSARRISLHVATLVAFLHVFSAVVEAKPLAFTTGNFLLDGDSNHLQLSNPPDVRLVLDKQQSPGFQSKESYLSGVFSVNMKLVPGDSAGTATTFYLHSATSLYDEVNFEFLGNVSGQPYKLHTNVYTNGIGDREQQMYLWFNPTHDFHNYKFVWNRYQVVWYVDDIPIRIFRNLENFGIKFLSSQSLHVQGDLFDASRWATRGGLDKVNYTKAPFIATYRDFDVDACTETSAGSCSMNSDYYWQDGAFQALSWHQENQLDWVRSRYLTYDYCLDQHRFPTPPPECAKNGRPTPRGKMHRKTSR